MPTTNANNQTKLTPPPPLSTVSANLGAGNSIDPQLVQVYFRQSSDGTNFVVAPTLLHAADARAAVAAHPAEYSRDGSTFASWPNAYVNSGQPVGGRGRLLGAVVASD